jgi:hypothetical protein
MMRPPTDACELQPILSYLANETCEEDPQPTAEGPTGAMYARRANFVKATCYPRDLEKIINCWPLWIW